MERLAIRPLRLAALVGCLLLSVSVNAANRDLPGNNEVGVPTPMERFYCNLRYFGSLDFKQVPKPVRDNRAPALQTRAMVAAVRQPMKDLVYGDTVVKHTFGRTAFSTAFGESGANLVGELEYHHFVSEGKAVQSVCLTGSIFKDNQEYELASEHVGQCENDNLKTNPMTNPKYPAAEIVNGVPKLNLKDKSLYAETIGGHGIMALSCDFYPYW